MECSEATVCRLCFTSDIRLIDIFNDTNVNIVEIVSVHFGEITRSDALPKYICSQCWKQTEEFHIFQRTVQNAQEEYLKQIIKYEVENEPDSNSHEITEQPNFVEVITNCDDFNEYAEDVKSIGLVDALHSDPAIIEEVDEFGVNADETVSDDDSTSSRSTEKLDSTLSKDIFAQHFDTTCDLCSVDLKTLNRAISHYQREHNEQGYIKCCGLKLKREKLVEDHIKWHINPEIFKCKFCNRIMKTKLSLAAHITNHKHSKTLTCDICGKEFIQYNRLKQHMLNKHSKKPECPICQKECANDEQLEDHLEYYHKPDECRKQWNQLKTKKSELDGAEVERMISTQFDMKCCHCENVFKSLQEAQYHYMHEHDIPDGFIQCCGLKFKKVNDIEGHVLWHLQPELFVCCICNKKFTTEASIRAHLRIHQARKPTAKFTCNDCDKTFLVKHQLNKHMREIHGIDVPHQNQRTNANQLDSSSLRQFFDMKCEVCQVELSSLQHAKLHYLEEHEIPDGFIRCCEMKFKEVKHINDHLQYHLNPDIFTCEICSRTFPRKVDLSTHVSRHKAVDTKKFSCNECGKIWRSKYALGIHKRSHEAKRSRTFPCEFCNRKFSTEKLRKSHTFRIHEANRELKTEICEYCAKTFMTRKEVLAHIRGMHMEKSIRREKVQCQICSAWLSNRYTLKEHMIRHNSEPIKCSQCDKVSPNQHALLCHVREVHVDRTYQCHLCPKIFKAAVALKDHVATHTGEKLHKCAYCPEAFIWRPNKYSHQKKAHPEEWKKSKSEIRRRKV